MSHAVTLCRNSEASAIGAAHLAGLATGFWPDLDALLALAAHVTSQQPKETEDHTQAARATWREAIARTTLRI
ncbi:MAG: glycerol kinase [Alteromonas macleodii]